MRNARTMLDCGYTSVLSGASAKPRLDIVIRNEINAGRIPGPRYLANGPEITVTGGLGDENELHLPHLETPTFAWVADGPEEIRKVCRLLVREGTDLFKLNVSGDTGPRDSRAERAVMTDAEVAAAMEIARAGGGARVRPRPQRRLGQDVPPPRPRHHLPRQLRRRGGARPARGQPRLVLRRPGARPHVPGLLRGQRVGLHARDGPRARARCASWRSPSSTMGRMRKRGIRVLPGGDYGFAWNPHGTYARDLLLFVDVLGFTPMETLVAATRLGGEIMGRPDELGQIKPGFLADLLLVDGDPLADIKRLQNRDALLVIMKDGRLHKSP